MKGVYIMLAKFLTIIIILSIIWIGFSFIRLCQVAKKSDKRKGGTDNDKKSIL